MVLHRTCSFCAGDIEPGTGQLYVKRDGSLYSFCSSSCRKQQMGLGRVGHRLRWTRAHELKRVAEQRRQPAAAVAPAEPAPKGEADKPAVAPAGRSPPGTAKKAAKTKPSEESETPAPRETEAAPKKARTKRPASSPASA